GADHQSQHSSNLLGGRGPDRRHSTEKTHCRFGVRRDDRIRGQAEPVTGASATREGLSQEPKSILLKVWVKGKCFSYAQAFHNCEARGICVGEGFICVTFDNFP